MSRYPRNVLAEPTRPLPALRFDINEVAGILRMSRAQVYKRIADGAIKIQKDGARTYATLSEIERKLTERFAPPGGSRLRAPSGDQQHSAITGQSPG